MRPVSLTQTGVGYTAPVPLDIRLNPANVALQARISSDASPSPSPSPSGSGTEYVVETTDSNVWGDPLTRFVPPDPADWLWTLHPDFDNAGTEVPKSDDWVGNLAFPATAVRLRITSGDGTIEFRVVQSGF